MAETRLGSTIGGRYTITDKLGQGGMSVVWLARDKRLERLQAVKEMKYDAANATHRIDVDLMRKEAHMMRNLDHPNIVHVNDIIDENNSLFVVMDYVPGKDLAKVMRENKEALQTGVFAFPEDDVIDWGIQLCQALGYLHEQDPPIIYRDMKPGNIMLQDDGQIKIIDFGIAREFKPNQQLDTTPLGTRGYASPEAVEKSSQTDARSDVYSLGVTLFHLVTGHSPLEYVTQPNLPPIRSINPDLSPALESILIKSNNWDPNLRQQSMAEMQWELQELPTPDMWVWMKKTFNTFKALTVAAGVCVVLGAGSLIASRIVRNLSFDGLLDQAEHATSTNEADGQPSAAEEFYTQAIELNPRDIRPYEGLIDNVYTSDDAFTRSEDSRWRRLYDKGQSNIRNARTEDGDSAYAQLCFWTGFSYLECLETSEAEGTVPGTEEWHDKQDEVERGRQAAEWFTRAKDAWDQKGNLSESESSLNSIAEDLIYLCGDVGDLIRNPGGRVRRNKDNKTTGEQWRTCYDKLCTMAETTPDLNADHLVKLRIYYISARLLSANAYISGFKTAFPAVGKKELLELVDQIKANTEQLAEEKNIDITNAETSAASSTEGPTKEEKYVSGILRSCEHSRSAIEQVYNAGKNFGGTSSTSNDTSTSGEGE